MAFTHLLDLYMYDAGQFKSAHFTYERSYRLASLTSYNICMLQRTVISEQLGMASYIYITVSRCCRASEEN